MSSTMTVQHTKISHTLEKSKHVKCNVQCLLCLCEKCVRRFCKMNLWYDRFSCKTVSFFSSFRYLFIYFVSHCFALLCISTQPSIDHHRSFFLSFVGSNLRLSYASHVMPEWYAVNVAKQKCWLVFFLVFSMGSHSLKWHATIMTKDLKYTCVYTQFLFGHFNS